MKKYNVIIIGAGPAGSYLAYKLKNQGLSILLLEKKPFPRYKSCAGGLSKKAYNILYSENKNIKNIVEKVVRKGLYVRNGKFTFVDAKKDLVYMTYRSELDEFLVEMAVDNKTVFFKDKISIKNIDKKRQIVTFTDKNKEEKVSYDILVGAWGANVKLNKHIGLYPFERFNLSSSWEGPAGPKFKQYSNEYMVTQIMKKYPGFVCYIFPKKEKITAGIFTSLYPHPSVWKNVWNDFADFWILDKSIKPTYALIPIRIPHMPATLKNNILLVGDAAGLADPYTGEGIHYALVSSNIAAENILKFFKEENFNVTDAYDEDIDLTFIQLMKWARVYEVLFQKFPNLTFWFGSEFPPGNEILLSLITGEAKYHESANTAKCFWNGLVKSLR